jgi:hypothetical protein
MILLRIIAAALATLIIGFLWYHPRVFGTLWMRLVNLSPEMVERGRRRSFLFMSLAFVCACATAYAFALFSHAASTASFSGALFLPLFAWLGFVVPTSLMETAWEERPWQLFAVNASYWLVTLVVVSLIIFV